MSVSKQEIPKMKYILTKNRKKIPDLTIKVYYILESFVLSHIQMLIVRNRQKININLI